MASKKVGSFGGLFDIYTDDEMNPGDIVFYNYGRIFIHPGDGVDVARQMSAGRLQATTYSREQLRQSILEEIRNDPTVTLWGMPVTEVRRAVLEYQERKKATAGPRLERAEPSQPCQSSRPADSASGTSTHTES